MSKVCKPVYQIKAHRVSFRVVSRFCANYAKFYYGMQDVSPLDRKRPGLLVPTHVGANHFEFEIEFLPSRLLSLNQGG